MTMLLQSTQTHPRVPQKDEPQDPATPDSETKYNDKPQAMALAAFISNIWAGFSAPAPFKRRSHRRVVYIDPDSIEPINHWFPGNRNKKQPRRLVETPTAGHWPEHRVAKKVVGKDRKRCKECGALVKEGERTGARERADKVSGKEKAKKSGGRKGKKETGVVRRLRGRVVEYAG